MHGRRESVLCRLAADSCVLDKESAAGQVWYVNMCVHRKLRWVLTAAAPGLEQRFDADLKEDRILQAQHDAARCWVLLRRQPIFTGPVPLLCFFFFFYPQTTLR